jgi:hypothetical protein
VTAEAQLDDPYVLIGSVAFVLIFRGGQHLAGERAGGGPLRLAMRQTHTSARA